jgi:DNA-binding IclR family transcriptional regulator
MTEAELLEALALASTAPEDARTVAEMAEASGISKDRVRQALGTLQRRGRLVVHRVRRLDISGHPQLVPAYTIRPVQG